MRLLDTFDLFGIALGMAAFRPGRPSRTGAAPHPVTPGPSGVDAVIDKVTTAAGCGCATGGLLDAVAELEALAAQAKRSAVRSVSSCATTRILTRMAAAVDVAWPSGRWPWTIPAAHLPRAVRWHRYSLDNGDRTCGADIAQGSLRLWSLAGGMPAPIPEVIVNAASDDPAGWTSWWQRSRREHRAGFAGHQPPRGGAGDGHVWPGLAVRAALAERLPQRRFVETGLGPGDAPVAVVFVVSGNRAGRIRLRVAGHRRGAHHDTVVAVSNPRSACRGWRDVLTSNRDRLARARPHAGIALGWRGHRT